MNGRILISASNLMVQCATFGIFGSGGGLAMGRRQTLKHFPQPHFILQLVREARECYISVIHPCREMIIFYIKCMLYFLAIILVMYLS